MTAHLQENNVNVIIWASECSYLNDIENLLGIIKKNLKEKGLA